MANTDRKRPGGTAAREAPSRGLGDAPTAARALAARVLARIEQDSAYATLALDAELGRAVGLEARDAALATELVYGVLRTAPELERWITRHARRAGWRKQPLVRAHMLMSAYSLAFLSRVPPHAAVSEAVSGVRGAADPHVARFANAVLRRVAAEAARGELPGLSQAQEASVPAWLTRVLSEAVGPEQARGLWCPEPAGPWLGLCLRASESQDEWVTRIAEAAPTAEVRAGRISERAVLIRGAGDPRRLPGAGIAWQVQEEGSQAIALCAGVVAGDHVLDACAGRGTKSWLLSEALEPGGFVDAADRDPSKLRHLGEPTGDARLVRNVHAVDWTRGPGEVPAGYDLALVDAPCTGLGTLRRRPELLQRLSAGDPARLGAVQQAIVRQVATRVRPGGRLVYAVCSVSHEETDGVVAALGQPRPGEPVLAPCPFASPLGQKLAGVDCTLRLLPGVHGTDGYFLASFRVELADR